MCECFTKANGGDVVLIVNSNLQCTMLEEYIVETYSLAGAVALPAPKPPARCARIRPPEPTATTSTARRPIHAAPGAGTTSAVKRRVGEWMSKYVEDFRVFY